MPPDDETREIVWDIGSGGPPTLELRDTEYLYTIEPIWFGWWSTVWDETRKS
jgi:hypothetical protein